MSGITPEVVVNRITFSDGKSYDIGPTDKVVIVGPNNAGKSLALREISQHISLPLNQNTGIKFACLIDLEFARSGNSNDLRAYLDSNFDRDQNHYFVGTDQINVGYVDLYSQKQMGPLGAIFCRHITTENRLTASEEQKSVSAGQRKSKAQHYLYDSQELLDKISQLFEDAFGQSLVVDYRGGGTIPIHVGTKPERQGTEDRVSDTYVAKVRNLPRLEKQGDGMRSYAGILFEGVVTKHNITLIDEPEAFLHPPQMRKLARTLVREVGGQLFVSTHSSDILRGFFDTPSTSVRVIRLQRVGDKNFSREPSAEQVKSLWENPDLRYSNALEGIFHEQCVLCEDDSDCRFYNALMDYQEVAATKKRWLDTVFVPCGGKHSISNLAATLVALGVRVRVIADMDLMSEEDTLRNVVESLGADWANCQRDWKIIDADVRSSVQIANPEDIKKQVLAAIDGSPKGSVPRAEIAQILRKEGPWRAIKQLGKAAIPKGAAQEAFVRLDENLRNLGLFLVPCGEVESFVPTVGGHGTKFVSEVLRTTKLGSPKLRDARNFVREACGPPK